MFPPFHLYSFDRHQAAARADPLPAALDVFRETR